MTKAGRLDYIDSARGIAILLIIWLHLGGNTTVPKDFLTVTKNISVFGVPLFFILSGFLFSISISKGHNTTKKIVLDKLKTVLLPFYALNICFLPFVYINQRLSPTSDKTWSDALDALLSFDISDSLPSGVLWFLFILFLAYIVTLAAATMLKNRNANILLTFFSIALLFASPYLYDVNFFGISRFAKTYVFFVLGFYYFPYFINTQSHKKSLVLSGVAAIISFYFTFYVLTEDTYLALMCERLSCILANLFMILTCKFLSEHCNIINAALKFFGLHSMSIFVFHTSVGAIFNAIIIRANLHTHYLTGFIWIFIAVLVPLIIEYILCYIPILHKIFLGRAPIFVTPRSQSKKPVS